jgi:hypothetical protein
MPNELLDDIANYLAPTEVHALADTCRTLRHTFQDEQRSRVLAGQAEQVRNFKEARELLNRIQTEISRPSRRSVPLAALATTLDTREVLWKPIRMTIDGTDFDWPRIVPQTRVREWHGNERAVLFDGIWTAIMQLPLTHQAAPLMQLVSTLGLLPGPELTARFNELVPQIMNLPPKNRSMPLAALAGELRCLNTSGQQAMFNVFIEHARQLPVEHRRDALEALVSTLFYMPQAAARFDSLLDEIQQLPAQHQGPILTSLAHSLCILPAASQPTAFERAIRTVEQLPPEQRSALLIAFTQEIRELAESARTTAFDRAFRATRQLDRPEDQAGQLIELATQIAQLPDDVRTERSIVVRNAIDELPNDPRAQTVGAN